MFGSNMRLKSKLKKLNPTIAFKHASSSGLLSVLETGRTPLVLRRALPLEFMDLRAGCSNGRLDELLLEQKTNNIQGVSPLRDKCKS